VHASSNRLEPRSKIYAEVEAGPDRFYEKCGFKRGKIWYSMCLTDESLKK
jgi:hypothetical protein